MNKRERFMSALKHGVLDCFPVQLDFSPKAVDKVAMELGLHNKEDDFLNFFGNHLVYAYLDDVYGRLKKRDNFEAKVIYDEWGIGWNVEQEGTFLTEHPLGDLERYKEYTFPDPNGKSLFMTAKQKVKKYAPDYIVCSYQVLCLFERAWALRGLENFMIDMIENKGFVGDLLDRITDYQVRVAERYVELGVDCGRTGDDYGGQSGMLFSPQAWRELIKPRLQRIWNVYQKAGVPVMHHSCGDVTAIIPDFIEMGLNILHPVQPEAMNIRELSKEYGKDLVFYGGLSMQKVLPLGTTSEVKEHLKECIEVLGRNHGYIIGPSNTITSDVSLQNIQALLEGIKEYNRC